MAHRHARGGRCLEFFVEVWGNGEQIRNWTYIDDIVDGTIRAAKRIDDDTAVNLGTMERIRLADAARMILDCMNVEVPLKFQELRS